MNKRKLDTYHHGDLRSDIIEKSSSIIAKNGSLDFSIRDISKLCGVSPAAIYRHFKTRNEIVVTIALEGIKILKNNFEEIRLSKNPSLIKLGMAYISFAKEYEGFFRAMNFRQIAEMKEYTEVETISEQLISYIFEFVAKGTPTNKVKMNTQTLIAYVHGASFLSIDGCINLKEKEIEKSLKAILN
ncbi:putative TetR-family regulatory protein [Halobacteriovorax marinus SJ]|uniref:TetR-family regulatory protein n=1 Tax=Halobacteriovorax marinus (strain ATCC BAA-682 / DSM 15412 / SJ) TaxID=862908 RepID=E1WY40_HALMS|nr:TetR/AcrR family transcriptional regulator [Halobacteriovorax marinus]CBW27595.1 putative TetR-family regulatory protein [Halobacteriovorax marinus SJ]